MRRAYVTNPPRKYAELPGTEEIRSARPPPVVLSATVSVARESGQLLAHHRFQRIAVARINSVSQRHIDLPTDLGQQRHRLAFSARTARADAPAYRRCAPAPSSPDSRTAYRSAKSSDRDPIRTCPKPAAPASGSPAAATIRCRRGMQVRVNIDFSSCGGPGRITITAPPSSIHCPGAVPRSFDRIIRALDHHRLPLVDLRHRAVHLAKPLFDAVADRGIEDLSPVDAPGPRRPASHRLRSVPARPKSG